MFRLVYYPFVRRGGSAADRPSTRLRVEYLLRTSVHNSAHSPPRDAFENVTRGCSIAVLHMELSFERKTEYPSGGGVFGRTSGGGQKLTYPW